jgi:poly(3-hydroxybutyrate) depolymerase
MRTVLFALLLACGGCGDDGGSGSPDSGGSGDGGGSGSDGSNLPVDASAGCNKPSSVAAKTWTKRDIDSNGAREVFIYLPENYDPTRPYPVIYELHGCLSQPNRETNNVPVEREIAANAIAVRGKAAADCWDTSTTGPDVPYFDKMLEDIENNFCVDTSRRFLTGYSSGSFMTHRLACIRGDKLRGVATIAGGQGGSNCTGNVAALLIHDDGDTTVNISASMQARDNHLMRNTCTSPPSSTPDADHPPCVEYAGCAAGKGVTWCQTTGQNHSRQDNLAAPIFWDFISSNL